MDFKSLTFESLNSLTTNCCIETTNYMKFDWTISVIMWVHLKPQTSCIFALFEMIPQPF